jgi:hypothetical protein
VLIIEFQKMDYIFEKTWSETVEKVSKSFGEKLDYSAIIFLIGLQELGHDYKPLKKDQKLDVMHIAICTLLEPFGYYEYEGRDADGWPHFKRVENLPALAPMEQETLIKRAIIEYFND